MNIKELKERFAVRLLDEKETEFLLSKVEKMQKTLEWYADEDNYRADPAMQSMSDLDNGERARAALKGDTQ
jgi:hypothetical protein